MRGSRHQQRGLRLALKRALDIAVAAPALVAAAPIIAGAAVATRLTTGEPAFFRQVRPGRYGAPFSVHKLRTMRELRGADGALLPDAQRLTKLGEFLRATSIDELPQLWNVVKGDMSLVGPRPLLMRYLGRYSAAQARRHDVLPGITGWAQINGRNTVEWRERFAMDVWYVDHWSPALDVRILLKTFRGVLRREGISEEGAATMTEFMGDPEQAEPQRGASARGAEPGAKA